MLWNSLQIHQWPEWTKPPGGLGPSLLYVANKSTFSESLLALPENDGANPDPRELIRDEWMDGSAAQSNKRFWLELQTTCENISVEVFRARCKVDQPNTQTCRNRSASASSPAHFVRRMEMESCVGGGGVCILGCSTISRICVTDLTVCVGWELPYLSGCGSPAACRRSLSSMRGCWTSCWEAGGGAEEPQVLPDWGLLVEAQVGQTLPRTCRPPSPWTVLRSGQWKRWGRSEGLRPSGGGQWKPPSSVPAWWRSVAPKTCEKQPARSKGRQWCGSPGRGPTEELCWRAGPGSRGSGPLRGGAAANWGHAYPIPSWSRTRTGLGIQDDQRADANPPGSV